jgi:hypothetical protein
MAGGGDRKIGQNKRKPTNIAYKAQDRRSKNKRLRAARQMRIEAAHAEKRVAVTIKRKRGAVKRLERRIAAGNALLASTLAKAKAALTAAEA